MNGHSSDPPSEEEPPLGGFGPAKENPGAGLIFVGVISLMTWASAIVIGGLAAGVAGAAGSGRAGSVLGLRAGFTIGGLFGLWLGVTLATRMTAKTQARVFALVGAVGGFVTIGVAVAVVVASLDSRAGALLMAAAGFPLSGPILAIAGILAPGVGAALLVRIATSRGLVSSGP